MKIRRIPGSPFRSIDDSLSLEISPQLQILFGYIDADTSAIRNGIRNLYYGKDQGFLRLDTDKVELEIQFGAESSIASRLSDGLRLRDRSAEVEWKKLFQEVDHATYKTFFDLNFGSGEVSGSQLCFQLQQRFNVPFGDVSLGQSDSENVEGIKSEIARINREISACRDENDRLHDRMEALEGHEVRPYEFEYSQKKSLESRIEGLELKLADLKIQACEWDNEIELAKSQAVPASAGMQLSSATRTNHELANQISRVDEQIKRWKTVKQDVDERITDLKTDVIQTRADAFDLMFEDIRMIASGMESRLVGLQEKNDSDFSEVDGLIEMSQQLVEGLDDFREQWRAEIVRGEHDSLKRCANELDRYLNRLVTKRNRLERRQDGKSGSVPVAYRSSLGNGKSDLQRIESLKEKQVAVLKEMEATERQLSKAKLEWQTIENHPNLLDEIELVRERIQACNEDHSVLQAEKDRLLNRLRSTMGVSEKNSRLIEMISEYASQLTGNTYARVFLDEKGRDLVLVDLEGIASNYQDHGFVTRSKIRMAVSLGCARLLAESGFSVPLVWEDAIVGFDIKDMRETLDVLSGFSKQYCQILLLTNNRFVRQFGEDRNVPCLDLPDRYSGDAAPSLPRESTRKVTLSTATDWTDINRRFDLAAMDQYGTDSRWMESCKQDTEFGRLDFVAQRGVEIRVGARPVSHKVPDSQNVSPTQTTHHDTTEIQAPKKFHLELSSRVEAAPTIGPKTAEKLEKIGICTVADLLSENAALIAEQLDNRRIKEADVLSWQQQAQLVCQVPNLRGHDAQLLVACNVTRSSQLAGVDPAKLFEVIGPFARSKEGKKLLRGSTEPDLKEVENWVSWAQEYRKLQRAA